MIWWLQKPQRFLSERADVAKLEGEAPWLHAVAWRFAADMRVEADFEIVHLGETFPLTLRYPLLFPATPISVLVREERWISSHQWGVGGELCLEHRAENWEEHVTGAMMIESAYRLIAGERPEGGRGIVPSAHSATLGQRLRASDFRFLLTATAREKIAALPVGSAAGALVCENKIDRVFVAALKGIGGIDDDNLWIDEGVAPGSIKSKGIVIRVEALDSVPAFSEAQNVVDWLNASSYTEATAALGRQDEVIAALILSDATTARFIWIGENPADPCTINYKTIDEGPRQRRSPATHDALGGLRVGIVGCGSLGAKIAVSLARAGVGAFHLVDDDVLLPGNLQRHDLDWREVGQHKTAGLRRRIREVAPGCVVTRRQIALGAQEASGSVADTVEKLSQCDLIIDATANPAAFNFSAAAALAGQKPMVWGAVFAGGVGGYVVRVRPGLEPPPAAARRQMAAWYEQNGAEWIHEAVDYAIQPEDKPPLIADDADVSVIAAHIARVAVDTLIGTVPSEFLYPVYFIGLRQAWIFSQPFDTRPTTLINEPWTIADAPDTEALTAVLAVVKALFPDPGEPDASATAA